MNQTGVDIGFIINRRKELGLTQANMAEKLGMSSAPAYNKYEKGIYKFNADVVPLLANALNCKVEDIFLPCGLTKQKL